MEKIYYAGDLSSIESRFISYLAGQPAPDPLQPRVILCASHLLANYLRRLLASQGQGAFNFRFHTFDTLAAELLPLDYRKKKLISPLGELTLLKGILSARPGYFSPLHDKNGFLFALLATIQDLIDAGVDRIPAGVQKSAKLADLADILTAFRRAGEPFISRAGALLMAVEHLGRFTETFDSDSLVVYGFYDFTVLQRRFLIQASQGLNIRVFLTSGSGEAAEFGQTTIDFLAAQNFVRGDLSDKGSVVGGHAADRITVNSPGEQLPFAGGKTSGGFLRCKSLERLQTCLFTSIGEIEGKAAAPVSPGSSRETGTASAARVLPPGKNKIPGQQSLFGEEPIVSSQNAAIAPSPSSLSGAAETRPPEISDHSVQIISTPDEYAEVSAIARQIQSLAREGIDFSEIAVLLRNPEAYSQLIEDVFGASGIPYYLQAGIPLAQSHPAKSLLLLLELLGGDFPRFEVIEFACFAPLNWRSILSQDKASDFDAHVSPAAWNRLSAEAGVVTGLQSWYRRLRALQLQCLQDLDQAESGPAQAGSTSSQALKGGREFHLRLKAFQLSKLLEFLNAMDRWKQKIQGCRTWGDFSVASREAVEFFFYRGGSGREETPQVWDQLNAVIEAISTLQQVDPAASLKRWISALRETMENDRLQSGRFQSGCVSVLSVMGSRGTRHRVVIIPGMAERGFPLLARQDSILLDRERVSLNKAASTALPLKTLRGKEEQLLFQMCVCAARERLVLTWPRLETQGNRSRLPSHYLIRVAEALTGSPEDFNTLAKLPQFHRVALSELAPENSRDALTENQIALESLGDPSRVPVSLYQKVLHRSLSAYRARWSRRFTEHDGLIQSADLLSTIGEWVEGRAMSPSALETFATCSYKFFLRQLLRLEALQEPEAIETISALDKGTLVHLILDTYMRRAQSSRLFPLARDRAAELHELMDGITDKVFEETEERGITGYRLLWELASDRIRADLHAFVEREIDRQVQFIPHHFEVGFGRSDEQIELKLLDGRSIKLSGRIDRVDLNSAQTAIRVVDYKTGKKRLDEKAEFQAGRKLQLAIYLMAAAQMYHVKDLEKSLAEYYFVSSVGEFTVHPFSGENWKEKLERLRQLLTILHGALVDGLFPAFPGEGGQHCKWCDYTQICDNGVQRIYGFKSQSPLLQFKRSLEEFK